MEEKLYTVAEAAKLLKCNVSYVYKLHSAGLIKFLKLGNLKVRNIEIDRFLKEWEGWDLTNPLNPMKLEEVQKKA